MSKETWQVTDVFYELMERANLNTVGPICDALQQEFGPAITAVNTLSKHDLAAADDTRDIIVQHYAQERQLDPELCDRAFRMCEWITEAATYGEA
jgi:hypothetical protein